MAIRYTKIGESTNETTIAQGTLAELIQSPQTPGTKAWADDVPGVGLVWNVSSDYPDGAWFGDIGAFTSKEDLDAILPLTSKLASGVHSLQQY